MKSAIGNQCMMRILTDKYIQGMWNYKPSRGCVVIPKCVSYRYGWDMVLPPGWAYKSPSSLPQPSHSVRNEQSFRCYIEEFVFYVSRAQSCIRALVILKICAKSAIDYRFEERHWKWYRTSTEDRSWEKLFLRVKFRLVNCNGCISQSRGPRIIVSSWFDGNFYSENIVARIVCLLEEVSWPPTRLTQ